MAYPTREPAYNPYQQYSNGAASAAYNAVQPHVTVSDVANRNELEKELAYNEMQIKALKNELANMRADWRDMDSFDRKLAANRASIGDISTARAHMADIEGRRKENDTRLNQLIQWRWQSAENEKSRQADLAKQNRTDIKRLMADIEDLYIAMPKDRETRMKTMAKINRLQKELRDEYGVTYEPSDELLGNVNDWSDDEWELFRINNTDKNGRWYSAKAREKYANRPQQTAEAAEAAKKGAGTLTKDEADAKAAALKTTYNKAIDKAIPKDRSSLMYDLATSKGSYTENVMVDGKSYTVTFTQSTGGKIIAKCGSVTREF